MKNIIETDQPFATPIYITPLFTGIILYGLTNILDIEWGALWMYPVSLPLVVLCTNIIHKHVGSAVISCVFVSIPVLGFYTWKQQLLWLDMGYLLVHQPVQHALQLLWYSNQGLPMFLGITAINILVFHRYLGIIFVLLTLSTIWGGYLLEIGLQHLLYPSFAPSSTPYSLTMPFFLAEISRVFAVISVIACSLYACKKYPRQPFDIWGYSGCVVLTIVLSIPHITLVLWDIRPTYTLSEDLPTINIHLGVSVSPASISIPIDMPSIQQSLDAQGTEHIPSIRWWCNSTPRNNWKHAQRAYGVLAIEKTRRIEEILPIIPEIFARGITHIGIIGRNTMEYLPPLSWHMQYPVLSFFLDPPPADTQYSSVSTTNVISTHTDNCTILLQPTDSIDALVQHTQQIQPYCDYLFLQFSTTNADDKDWHSPVSCID